MKRMLHALALALGFAAAPFVPAQANVTAIYQPPLYTGNGTTTAFGFGYQYFAASDLTVTLFNLSTGQLVSPQPVLNGGATYDYTVTGVPSTPPLPPGEFTGATIAFNNAPPANYQITISRLVAPTQPASFPAYAPFPGPTLESTVDRQALVIQQFAILLAHYTIQTPEEDALSLGVTLPPAAQRAGQFFTFDSQGQPSVGAVTAALIDAALGYTPLNPANNGSDFASLPATRSNLSIAPHVPTDAALAGSTVAQFPSGILRDDYAPGNGAPPLFFAPQTGTCAANGMVSDGGSCVNEGSGNSFVAKPNVYEDVREFGAVCSTSSSADYSAQYQAAINAAGAAFPNIILFHPTNCVIGWKSQVVAHKAFALVAGGGFDDIGDSVIGVANNGALVQWNGSTTEPMLVIKSAVSGYFGTGTTHTSTLIDGMTSTTGLAPGELVNGPGDLGIPAGAKVATVASSTSITITLAAIHSATDNVTVQGNTLNGGSIDGPAFYGEATASIGIECSSCSAWRFSGSASDMTVAGLQIDDGNVQTSLYDHIGQFYYDSTGASAAANSSGVILNGGIYGWGISQSDWQLIVGQVANGAALDLTSADGNIGKMVSGFPSGTGAGIRTLVASSVGYPARNNVIGVSDGPLTLSSDAFGNTGYVIGASTFIDNSNGKNSIYVQASARNGQYALTGLNVPQAGTATNDNATSGQIGEYLASAIPAASAVSLANGVGKTVTSISLTPGDWDVSGTIGFVAAPGTTVTGLSAGVGQVNNVLGLLSDTSPQAQNNDTYTGNGNSNIVYLPTGTGRISLATTTTVYLVAYGEFGTSTLTAYGFIRARRAR
jgi:hypothetical protein